MQDTNIENALPIIFHIMAVNNYIYYFFQLKINLLNITKSKYQKEFLIIILQ